LVNAVKLYQTFKVSINAYQTPTYSMDIDTLELGNVQAEVRSAMVQSKAGRMFSSRIVVPLEDWVRMENRRYFYNCFNKRKALLEFMCGLSSLWCKRAKLSDRLFNSK